MKRSMPLRALLLAALAFASFAAGAQNFLWRVDSLTNHVWLFGTLHAGKASWYPLPKAVNEAYADARALVVEADITDRAAMQRVSPATYAPPDSLRRHVPPADYERLGKVLPRYGLGEAQIAPMKPFMVASLLVFAEWTRLGYLPQLGVDAYLLQRAHSDAKPVAELEGVAVQAQLMDSVTEPEGQAFLEGTLDAVESGLADRQIQDTVHAWEVGDAELLLDASRRYDAKVKGAAQFEEKFVWSRNDAMAAKIAQALDGPGGPQLVAVGALHLVGPRGLVERLKARGYTVQRVFVSPAGEEK